MNTDELVAFAESLADEARGILREAGAGPAEVHYKADASPVTEFDRRIEARLRAMIEARYPDHGILGEELGARDLDAELVWVLDPIDGTQPFIAGIPVYGTLIGLARDARPYLGVMEHPVTRDRWVGVAGEFARHNGRPVRTRHCGGLEQALVTTSNPDLMTPEETVNFQALKSRVRGVQYGGSCYAYGVLASGRTDLAIDGGLDPFDVFASIAVIEGAGGVVSDWSGKPIDLDWQGRIAAAGCAELHAQALAVLSSA